MQNFVFILHVLVLSKQKEQEPQNVFSPMSLFKLPCVFTTKICPFLRYLKLMCTWTPLTQKQLRRQYTIILIFSGQMYVEHISSANIKREVYCQYPTAI